MELGEKLSALSGAIQRFSVDEHALTLEFG